MAFAASGLQRLAGAGSGGQLFMYKTADAVATVTASGYFNSVTAQLRQHDAIIVIGSTGGTPTVDLIFVTSASAAATVTTSSTEGVTAT